MQLLLGRRPHMIHWRWIKRELNSFAPCTGIALLILSLFSFPSHASLDDAATYISAQKSFLQCLARSAFPTNLIFTPADKNYTSVFFSTVQNIRPLTNSPKPLLIITPTQESHVQLTVLCSKNLNLPIRIRSGGHDAEGLSYISIVDPVFIIIDLQKLTSVDIDASVSTAWVQAGATLGELYYSIAMKSKVAAFPAGECPSIGVGGHFSGGGVGYIMRAHGLSIDNIIDARVVSANGDILDRESMGEDFFWALRGGGGASFGIILSYKIKLVQVPPKVTVFDITKTLLVEEASKMLSKFHAIAYELDKRTHLVADLKLVKQNSTDLRVQITFHCLFLGEKREVVSLMEQSFSELKLKENDCTEMRWIESVVHIAGHPPSTSLSILLDRRPKLTKSGKVKCDFLTKSINDKGWEKIIGWLLKEDVKILLTITPVGGKVNEISETETPFPHRKGVSSILYTTSWPAGGMEESQKHLKIIRRLHEFMAPYVSRNPRAAYLNLRDLDLGINGEGNTSYTKASIWGEKYFKGNFKKLAQVKSRVDPTNLFRNEQSIPLLY